jgi:hypothetical protein
MGLIGISEKIISISQISETVEITSPHKYPI